MRFPDIEHQVTGCIAAIIESCRILELFHDEHNHWATPTFDHAPTPNYHWAPFTPTYHWAALTTSYHVVSLSNYPLVFFMPSYHWGPPAPSFNWHPLLKPHYPAVCRALQLHQETISTIRILELNNCGSADALYAAPAEPILFSGCTAIKHLAISMLDCIPKNQRYPFEQLLPSTLCSLSVQVRSAKDGACDDFFISLAEAAQSHMPGLKFVHVSCRIETYSEDGYLPLHFCHLRRMFASRGIQFSYHIGFVNCEFTERKFTLCGHLRQVSDKLILLGDVNILRCVMSIASADSRGIAYNTSHVGGCSRPGGHFNGIPKHRWGYMEEWSGPSDFERELSDVRS